MSKMARAGAALLAAAATAFPATPQQVLDPRQPNPTRADVKSQCADQLNAAARLPDFNAPRFGGMSMIDSYIDSALRLPNAELAQEIQSETRRISSSGDYQISVYAAATACFYTRIVDYRARNPVPASTSSSSANTYSSVCYRNREKIQKRLQARGIQAYAATYDLFNIDMNDKWVQLYAACVSHDSTIKGYEEFTRKSVTEARQYCAGPHNAQSECLQWGYSRPADNQRAYQAFLEEFNLAMSDPNYSADLGPVRASSGAATPAPRPSPAAPTPAPAAPAPAAPAPDLPDPVLVLETGRSAIKDAAAARPEPGKEGSGVAPGYAWYVRATQRDFEKEKLRTKKLHHAANDTTGCIKVEATGVRSEWGTEGKFRLVNACAFPIEASWCANVEECSGGRGNLWTIQPFTTGWPIFFANPDAPHILVGACRVKAERQPWPSDAAIARAGGVDTQHREPAPAPGVGVMPDHKCE